MRAIDEDIWEQQRAELLADGKVGSTFLEVLEFWVDEAEKMPTGTPAEALRQALTLTEERFGRIEISYLGQMLAVIIIHWERGEEVANALTPIELHLVQDITYQKILSQAQKAAEDPEEEGS